MGRKASTYVSHSNITLSQLGSTSELCADEEWSNPATKEQRSFRQMSITMLLSNITFQRISSWRSQRKIHLQRRNDPSGTNWCSDLCLRNNSINHTTRSGCVKLHRALTSTKLAMLLLQSAPEKVYFTTVTWPMLYFPFPILGLALVRQHLTFLGKG